MSEFNFKQPYVGFNAIIQNQNGEILMVKEADGPGKNKWNYPGGRWDKKETLLEGVGREVKEETGYDFTPTGIVGLYSKFRERPSMTVVALQIMFTGDITGEKGPIAADILESKFFKPEEIQAMTTDELFDPQYKEALADFTSKNLYPLSLISHGVNQEPDFD